MLGHDIRSQSDSEAREWSDLVRHGHAIPVLPTTDSGSKLYGPGRLMLPAGTNYCTNPSLEDNDGTSPAGFSMADSVSGTPTPSMVAGRKGGVAFRQQYTGGGGDSGKIMQAYSGSTAVGSFAAGDIVTMSAHYKGSCSGMTVRFRVLWQDAAAGSLDYLYSPNITLSAEWQQVSVSGVAPANTSRCSIVPVYVTAIDDGDTIDITIDDVLIEKSSVLTPYYDGSYPDCAWTGAANASTSTRAASVLETPIALTPPYTVAGRFTPLFASTSKTTYRWGMYPAATGGPPFAVDMWEAGGSHVFRNNNVDVQAQTIPANAAGIGVAQSVVARWDAAYQNYMTNGTASAPVATGVSFPASSFQRVIIGSGGYSYIGPFAVSPSCITDAETVLLDAGLTAGWGGLELFRFFRDRGYAGTLILPLQSDSVGYLVT